MNFLKLFIKQIKSHPILVSFFIFGYSISILMLSVSTSNMVTMKNLILEQSNGISKNSVNIGIQYSKDINFDDMSTFFKDISPNSKVRFENIATYFETESDKEQYPIISEYFINQPEWKVPIIKGRYYTSKEILQSNKVALIGKGLKRCIHVENGVEKITMGGETFDLIGIVGDENRDTAWDSTIFMPITAIPNMSKVSYFNFQRQKVVLTSGENKQFQDLENIKSNIALEDENATVYVTEVEGDTNIFLNLVSMNSEFIMIAVVVIILSIANMMNLTSFWIRDRKGEIAIRKAFGISNFNISMLLFSELLSITLVTAVSCIVSQYILSFLVKNIFGYYIIIYKENYAIAILVSLGVASITSIIPILKALKIQPIEVFRD